MPGHRAAPVSAVPYPCGGGDVGELSKEGERGGKCSQLDYIICWSVSIKSGAGEIVESVSKLFQVTCNGRLFVCVRMAMASHVYSQIY